jgi:predicted HicB family RNase H-like nuclease
MSMEQKGKFITLLCIQHQKGHMSERDMLQICGTYDEDIFSKFQKDSEGKFFNVRLEQEVDKRKSYSESRRNNRMKKEDVINISDTYVQHMENENENTIKEKKVSAFQKPTLSELKTYMTEIGMADVSEKWFDYYESNGWLVGKNKMKNWKAAVRTWKSNNLSNNTTTPQIIHRKVFNLQEYDERT